MSLSPTDASLGFVLMLLALLAFIVGIAVRPHTVVGRISLFTTGCLALLVTIPYALAMSGRPFLSLAMWIDGAWIAAALAFASAVLLVVALRLGELRSYVVLAAAALVAFSICGASPLVV